jgi:hypothetical protein
MDAAFAFGLETRGSGAAVHSGARLLLKHGTAFVFYRIH